MPTPVYSQVLDDSTCKHTRDLVDDAATEWQERGVRVEVVRRTNRAGYKAGALKDVGPTTPHSCLRVVDCESGHRPRNCNGYCPQFWMTCPVLNLLCAAAYVCV